MFAPAPSCVMYDRSKDIEDELVAGRLAFLACGADTTLLDEAVCSPSVSLEETTAAFTAFVERDDV